jgi:hypothetical protein
VPAVIVGFGLSFPDGRAALSIPLGAVASLKQDPAHRGDHAEQRLVRIPCYIESEPLPSATPAVSIRRVDLIIATRTVGQTTETQRVPDVPAAQEIVRRLDAGTRWTLYEKRHTRWCVRRTGKTGLDTTGCS